jgi:hypothetical protein
MLHLNLAFSCRNSLLRVWCLRLPLWMRGIFCSYSLSSYSLVWFDVQASFIAAVNCFCKFVSINNGFCVFHRVDIMVQPSWTWGPVGPLEFDTDAFRAVENGFTLLRCSSVGVSGVVSPFYRVLEYRCMQILAPWAVFPKSIQFESL